MKPVLDNPQFTESIIVKRTPRQQLAFDLACWIQSHEADEWEFEDVENAVNDILSKYSVGKEKLTSVMLEIPEDLTSKQVTVNYQPGEATAQTFKGEVLKVLYRDTAYDMASIMSILTHPNISEEQKSMLKMTVWEETKPKIYHRLVLNTQEQGILIIPLLKGVTIEQE